MAAATWRPRTDTRLARSPEETEPQVEVKTQRTLHEPWKGHQSFKAERVIPVLKTNSSVVNQKQNARISFVLSNPEGPDNTNQAEAAPLPSPAQRDTTRTQSSMLAAWRKARPFFQVLFHFHSIQIKCLPYNQILLDSGRTKEVSPRVKEKQT